MAGWNAILSLGGAALILISPQGEARVSGWRPGERRADTGSMLRVDQAGEYGATRIYAGQLAVLRPQLPRSQAHRADGGAGGAPPRPLRHTDGRTAGPPDRAPAAVERRRLRARRRDRADVGEGGAGLHRRGGDRDRPALRPAARLSSATTIPSLRPTSPSSGRKSWSIATPRERLAPKKAIGYPLLTAAIRGGCRVAIALVEANLEEQVGKRSAVAAERML